MEQPSERKPPGIALYTPRAYPSKGHHRSTREMAQMAMTYHRNKSQESYI